MRAYRLLDAFANPDFGLDLPESEGGLDDTCEPYKSGTFGVALRHDTSRAPSLAWSSLQDRENPMYSVSPHSSSGARVISFAPSVDPIGLELDCDGTASFAATIPCPCAFSEPPPACDTWPPIEARATLRPTGTSDPPEAVREAMRFVIKHRLDDER